MLAGYCAWHVLRCADLLRARAAGRGQLLAGAHLTTAVAMTVMLLGMV